MLLAGALLSAGCVVLGVGSTVQLYPGAARPREQVAVLKLVRNEDIYGYPHAGIGVREIDGRKVRYDFGDTLELLPGGHAMSFVIYAPLNSLSSGTITKGMRLRAGKTYRAEVHNYGLTSTGESNSGTSSRSRWWVEITEEP